MPNIIETSKYASLQMAAEALYGQDANEANKNKIDLVPGALGKPLSLDILTDGNRHASKFMLQDAMQFVNDWTVLEHRSNTSTGFSGTLFQNKDTKEVVISFRSTEFLDDSARDNQATNALEIKAFGWAFGQIADMNKWWEELKEKYEPELKNGVSVTGYSLGGHLATAFNLLHKEADSDNTKDFRIKETYTFNGAGVGEIKSGKLSKIIEEFNTKRAIGSNEDLFKSIEGLPYYKELVQRLSKCNNENIFD